jgi:hypothetical protein
MGDLPDGDPVVNVAIVMQEVRVTGRDPATPDRT